MTLSEFKAWFEGFTEDMEEAPTKKQWARIKGRVKEIDGVTITERVFVDRYWPPQRLWYYGMSQTLASAQCHNNHYQNAAQNFNSAQALGELGRAEYRTEDAQ